MELQNIAIKGINRHIGGWVSVIVGGMILLLGIGILVEEIITALSEWYQGFLGCTVPCFVIGIPLIIFGIRRIKNVRVQGMIVSKEMRRVNNRAKAWGWVTLFFGVLSTAFGYLILMIEIMPIESADWYWSVLVVTVPSWIVGIPLIIIGIRRINKVELAENIGVEFVTRKSRPSKIWGWVAVSVGGFFTWLSFSVMIISILDVGGTDAVTYMCIGSGLIVGILLLVVGSCRIYKLAQIESSAVEETAGKNGKRRIWRWVLIIIGVLVMLASIGLSAFFAYALFILAPLKGLVPHAVHNIGWFIITILSYALPLSILGITLLALGFITASRMGIDRRSRGWVLNVFSAVYLVDAIISVLVLEALSNNTQGQGGSMIIWFPFILAGIMCFIFGILDVKHTETIPPENPVNLDKPYSEVEPG